MGWAEGAKTAIYAVTAQGAERARSLAGALPGSRIYLPQRLADPEAGEHGFERLSACLAENFGEYAGHVIFAATGIVVRGIAPLLQHKAQDPAVVVADHLGRNVISLLSGHLGGANHLARIAAAHLGGRAVITTATDLEDLPSLEMVAKDRGCKVENLSALARLSGSLLDGEAVPLWDPEGWLAPALAVWPGRFIRLSQPPDPVAAPGPLVWVGWQEAATHPAWLLVRPPCLVAGMGCRRAAPPQDVAELLFGVLQENSISPLSIARLASIEEKREEPALIQLAARLGVDMVFFDKDELNRETVPNPSARVEKHMGVKSVCEAAALAASKGGKLLVQKTKSKNATCALALASPPAA